MRLISYLPQRRAVWRTRLLAVARHARRPLLPDGETLLSRQAYLCFIHPIVVKNHRSFLLSDADWEWQRYCYRFSLVWWRA